MKCVFIVLDTVRRDYLAGYGNDWVHTPSLTRLAERGITFDNHWTGSLPCMPARRELMTGRYNFVYRGWGPIEPYDDTLPGDPTIADIACFPYIMLSEEGGISRLAYPAICRWTDRFRQIPNFIAMSGIFEPGS